MKINARDKFYLFSCGLEVVHIDCCSIIVHYLYRGPGGGDWGGFTRLRSQKFLKSYLSLILPIVVYQVYPVSANQIKPKKQLPSCISTYLTINALHCPVEL